MAPNQFHHNCKLQSSGHCLLPTPEWTLRPPQVWRGPQLQAPEQWALPAPNPWVDTETSPSVKRTATASSRAVGTACSQPLSGHWDLLKCEEDRNCKLQSSGHCLLSTPEWTRTATASSRAVGTACSQPLSGHWDLLKCEEDRNCKLQSSGHCLLSTPEWTRTATASSRAVGTACSQPLSGHLDQWALPHPNLQLSRWTPTAPESQACAASILLGVWVTTTKKWFSSNNFNFSPTLTKSKDRRLGSALDSSVIPYFAFLNVVPNAAFRSYDLPVNPSCPWVSLTWIKTSSPLPARHGSKRAGLDWWSTSTQRPSGLSTCPAVLPTQWAFARRGAWVLARKKCQMFFSCGGVGFDELVFDHHGC